MGPGAADQEGREGAEAVRPHPAMRRLLVVTNIPTPYRVPLFNVLDAALRGAGWAM